LVIVRKLTGLLAYPDAYIYQLTEEGFERILYEDMKYFKIFIKNRKKTLQMLMENE